MQLCLINQRSLIAHYQKKKKLREVAMAEDLHVVMLPWLAFGHLIPFLQLSKGLAKNGIRISFISTPRNIERLPKIPPDLAAQINFVKFPLPYVDNLPENAEATIDVPEEKIPYLKKAYDLLQHPFEQFITRESPDWVVHDVLPYWAPEITLRMGVPSAAFSIYPASSLAFIGPPESFTGEDHWEPWSSPEAMTSPPKWIPFPSSLALRRHEAVSIFNQAYGENESGVLDSERLVRVIKACQVFSIRSCNEYDGEYLDLLEVLYGKPVIPVGLLPQPSSPANDDWLEVFKWLDERQPRSVVFVAFGSECGLRRDQVFEIASGLELSRLPFIWALRKPHWAADDMDALPEEFRDRNSGRGVVRMGWAPQSAILAHKAIGGCLIHSGYSSIIESLQHGHSLVALPVALDQGINARRLVEKGLAVEVERNEDGSFTGSGIAMSLRHVMVEEEGDGLRHASREMRRLIPEWEINGDYIARFSRYLKDYKRNDPPT